MGSVLNADNGVSKEILYFLNGKGFELTLNDISIINIHYFTKKGIKAKDLWRFVNIILDTFIVALVDVDILKKPISLDFTNLEDAIRYFCVKSIDADLINSKRQKKF